MGKLLMSYLQNSRQIISKMETVLIHEMAGTLNLKDLPLKAGVVSLFRILSCWSLCLPMNRVINKRHRASNKWENGSTLNDGSCDSSNGDITHTANAHTHAHTHTNKSKSHNMWPCQMTVSCVFTLALESLLSKPPVKTKKAELNNCLCFSSLTHTHSYTYTHTHTHTHTHSKSTQIHSLIHAWDTVLNYPNQRY